MPYNHEILNVIKIQNNPLQKKLLDHPFGYVDYEYALHE
jgi:hypothetical protein